MRAAFIALLLLGAAVGAGGAFALWARSEGSGGGARVVVDVPSGLDASGVSTLLAERGLVRTPWLFAWYLRLGGPPVVPGRHLLRDDLGPRALAQRLTRSPLRPRVRLLVPEGFHHRQIAARLAELEVCPAADFEAAVFDRALLAQLRLAGPSAEGYLFPATYDLLVDSDPKQLVQKFVEEARRRFARLAAKHPGAAARLATEFGFDEAAIVTLASIVEREAADPTEQPLVASVFFNRLRDATFRPLRSLQSDPTAAYGCLVEPQRAPSCAGFNGQVTPAMLRDASNRYNTYRHPSLPPGPIANPGESALAAVLAPATSEYLYFVATGHGRHTFSRTFEEHRQAVTR